MTAASFSTLCLFSALLARNPSKIYCAVDTCLCHCSVSLLPVLPFCKRTHIREQLAVKYGHLFQEFPDLRSLLPNPANHTCKRTWERACFRCCELCRLGLGVEDRGERASCHNFVIAKHTHKDLQSAFVDQRQLQRCET